MQPPRQQKCLTLIVNRGLNGHYDLWCALVLFITGYHGDWWLATAADDVDGDGDVLLWSVFCKIVFFSYGRKLKLQHVLQS